MARKKPEPLGQTDNEKLIADLAAAATAEPENYEKHDKGSAIIDLLKDKTNEWKVRELLAAPFHPGNLKAFFTERGGSTGLVELAPHELAIFDRLDSVLGMDGWSLTMDPVPCVRLTRLGVVRQYGDKYSDEVNFGSVIQCLGLLVGIGRYLEKIPPFDPSGPWPKLPDWALPKLDDKLPVYGSYPNGAAAAATKPKDKPKEEKPAPEPEKPKAKAPPIEQPEAPVGGMKFATPQDTAKNWELILATVCNTPDKLNTLCRDRLSLLELDHKKAVWLNILAFVEQKGWLWDKDNKEFFDPEEGAEEPAPGGIPW